MLDISYPTFVRFVCDCTLCGYDAGALIQSGKYVRTMSGRVVSREYL